VGQSRRFPLHLAPLATSPAMRGRIRMRAILHPQK
jgi:hypothetical protein